MQLNFDRRVADSVPKSWVDTAPVALRPYLPLARYDRPIGFWLLTIPCWQGLMLANINTGLGWIDLWYAVLFALGAVAMRGAGCTYNDIIDRELDARVARTASRPLPAGTVSLRQAWIFLVGQSLVGLLVLIQLPWPAILVGLASLLLVAAYPFMKRITWWPQAWLGLTFNWGALMGYAAAAGTVELPAILLYAGGFFWTLGYDTIYAHQDKDDDALIGVKSSARKLGNRTRPALWIFYGVTVILWALAAREAGFSHWFLLGFAGVVGHLIWQTVRVDINSSKDCLAKFRSNIGMGYIMLLALLMGGLMT